MQPTTSALQVFIDFWLSLIKLLGRPAVQIQLLTALGAVLLAWLLVRWFEDLLRRRQARRQRQRPRRVAPEAPRQTDAGDASPDSEHYGIVESGDEDASALEPVKPHLGKEHRLYQFMAPLFFPGLAILLLYGVYVYFVIQNWYSGLLADLILLFGIYFLYRLAVSLAGAIGSPARVHYYDVRLFAPLFASVVLLLVVNTIIDLNRVASATLYPVETGWLTLGAFLLATVGFYFWIVILSLLKDSIIAAARRSGQINSGSLDAALTLVQYGLIALGLFTVFRILQFNTATIAAITGGLSIGIGFALQDVLRNFLGGIIVLFEGSVRPGDWVQISGTEGEVDKLSIRSTVVRTFDDVEYIVPNQNWLTTTVTTYTKSSRRVRTRVPVRVANSADPRTVQELLIETARVHPTVLDEPSPLAPLVNFGAAGIDFVVLAWVDDAKEKEEISDDLRLRIWDALKANGVGIV